MDRLKILVIDDSPVHQQAARQTITEHDLTVVGSYDEAYWLIGPREVGDPECTTTFDVVLTDLLMPAGRTQQGNRGLQFVGQEMPVGFGLALTAVIHGAKWVAVVTDMNHHNHPASALLDPFRSRCPHEYDRMGEPTKFIMNGTRVGFYNSLPMVKVEGAQEAGKDWGEILKHLLTAPELVGE